MNTQSPVQEPKAISSSQIAKDVFKTEAYALLEIEKSLDADFDKAIDIMHACKGRIVVTGMGKSGHIGSKIAATLASTGSPSFFVHPAEMGHGDLGMLKAEDVVIGISFSGNTEELRKVLSPIKRLGVPLVSITGNMNSALAEFADVTLLTPITKEACPLDLAPTSSTTAALVMGDAIAVALMKKRDFSKEDFARSHPLGSLGKSLVLVSDVMRKKTDFPAVNADANYDELLREINDKKLGLTTVLDQQGKLLGIITDGDLRRAQTNLKNKVFDAKASEIMSPEPKTIKENTLAVSALNIMETHRISDVVVVNEADLPIGIIDLKDLLKAGLI